MTDPRDRIEIDGIEAPPSPSDSGAGERESETPRRFLMIWFRCCHAYGRLARNQPGTHYEGRCPRCAASVSVRIGPGGSDRRMFEAR